jgi:hypothetical protein
MTETKFTIDPDPEENGAPATRVIPTTAEESVDQPNTDTEGDIEVTEEANDTSSK